MGVNVSIVRPDDGHHWPSWDDSRYSVDRNFWEICKDVELHTLRPANWERNWDDRLWHRPKDFDAFRAIWSDHEDGGRYLEAADILEANPDYWLYFGY